MVYWAELFNNAFCWNLYNQFTECWNDLTFDENSNFSKDIKSSWTYNSLLSKIWKQINWIGDDDYSFAGTDDWLAFALNKFNYKYDIVDTFEDYVEVEIKISDTYDFHHNCDWVLWCLISTVMVMLMKWWLPS